MTAQIAADGFSMARSIEDVALAQAGPSERNRTLTEPLVKALWDSGLMQFMNPKEGGGHEPGFRELIDTWVELARQDGSLGWIVVAGLLVGFGTKLGNGCTSGHGICGIGRLSKRSIVATCVFMASAMLTVFIRLHL